MAELKTLFKLAPSLAIKYFKNKNNKFTWDWYELWQDAHKKSFTVAKVMREDILKDIRSALDKALEEGKTFKDFSKELKPTLQKCGWWSEQIIVDKEGNGFDETVSYNYSQHDRIENKPILQFIGKNLIEENIKLNFHRNFCVPEDEIKRLVEVADKAEPLKFIKGNGEYIGVFVIEEISKTTEQTTPEGDLPQYKLKSI